MTVHFFHPRGPKGVRYTIEDVRGWFADALNTPEMKGAEIVGGLFYFGPNNEHLGAVIRNYWTGIEAEYGMNVAARKPYMIRVIRVFPIDKKRRGRRYGSKEWRARRGWEER